MRIDWLAGPATRRHADEEARYALRDHGDRAEAALQAKMAQTQSKERRQIYRLALKRLQRLR